MQFETLTDEQVEALAVEAEARRAEALALGRSAAAQRNRRLAEAHAAYYGLTADEYAAVKQKAATDGVPLASALGRARKAKVGRDLQVARAGVAEVRGEAKGV